MQIDKNIYLIGFMGVGKSTVSRRLHKLTGLAEIDTDEEIVRREGRPITQIFAEAGEEYFRTVEASLMRELSKNRGLIVSCGGGVALREANVEAMKAGGIIVWLRASAETIYEHIKEDNSRPILDGHMNVDYIAELMAKRESYYETAHTIAVDTDGKHSNQIAKEIIQCLKLEN